MAHRWRLPSLSGWGWPGRRCTPQKIGDLHYPAAGHSIGSSEVWRSRAARSGGRVGLSGVFCSPARAGGPWGRRNRRRHQPGVHHGAPRRRLHLPQRRALRQRRPQRCGCEGALPGAGESVPSLIQLIADSSRPSVNDIFAGGLLSCGEAMWVPVEDC